MEEVCLNPLVSICIPAHNAEKYLNRTINVLLSQNYPNVEIVIVNDHSTDKTGKIIADYNNPKIKSANTTKRGAASARNEAYKYSKGELIIFFDADDLVDVNFISEQVKFWQSKRSNSIIMSRWGRFYNEDASDFILEPEETDIAMDLRSWVIKYWTEVGQMTIPARILIPRQILEQAGAWNEELSLNDDFEFYTRLFGFAKQIFVNPNCALHYRSGVNGLSQQKKSEEKQKAQFLSISLATAFVLKRYQDTKVRLACANILQSFVYECYPMLPTAIKNAQGKIKDLGGSKLKFQAGGITRMLVTIFDWKTAKRIKQFISN
jgi:glycosyltransferase involved in cell wall biosynthesis